MIHPAVGQVLVRDVTLVDQFVGQGVNPEVSLRSGTVVEIGPMPANLLYEFMVGDTVYFSDQAPMIRWSGDLAQVQVMSIIAHQASNVVNISDASE